MRIQKPKSASASSASQTPPPPSPSPPTAYERDLDHNLSLSRTISFHTSPSRLLSTRSFAIALRATRSLTSSVPSLRRAAALPWHLASVAALHANLASARTHAARKASSVPLAHDVFALLCGFLGADARPHKAVQDDDQRRARDKETRRLRALRNRSNTPHGAFVRVASGIVKGSNNSSSTAAAHNGDQHLKRKFGQSISFMHRKSRRGLLDDDQDDQEKDYEKVDDESTIDSDPQDDLFAANSPQNLPFTRVRSIHLSPLAADETPTPLRPDRPRTRPLYDDAAMRRVKSSYADYFAVRVADLDT